ncbi:prolipoprotein diacylglyceryltransferase [Microlunatus parietis]|uniref:Prolipoprotein diacylglyceryltransferase n=1 Tax=Microlunatus parietis TaxID=682979 RepID=A0A7Y9I9G2_9ACTN|nr:prolipoprotein diacylglyceryltransferase [Microlunatus parietis]
MIDPQHRPAGYEQYETFHPTFLYELLWCLAAAAVLIMIDRRLKLGRGKVFALYVALYTAGRFWIEALRIDPVNEVGGFRLNNYTSLIVFVAAVIVVILLFRFRPGREEIVEGDPPEPTNPDPDPKASVAQPADR